MKLIECVPNFSEGIDKNVINSIIQSIKSVNNVHLLDVDSGISTNRTVVTFIGAPDSVLQAAFDSIKIASKLIDMSRHKGTHPRMGATDVCPLIPVANVTMKECIEYSHKLALRVSSELNIPIFMYENSSSNKQRSNLSFIRKGEYEGMFNKLKDSDWKPDYGNPTMNKRSGITAIGAREFLIAYNVNLNTQNKRIASDIALDIREAGRAKRDKNRNIIRDSNGSIIKVPGKLKYCKAVGWYIDEYNQAQVSINLTNYKKTSLFKTFEEVRKQARKRGVRVTGSEIVGLIPKKALIDAGCYYIIKQNESTGIPDDDIMNIAISSLGLNDIEKFNVNEKVIELSIQDTNKLTNLNVESFIDEISRGTPTPGGGSVCALVSSIAASLSAMVSNLTIHKKGFERYKSLHINKSTLCQSYKNELIDLVNQDSKAYDNVIKAHRLPNKTKNEEILRIKQIEKANICAAETPLKILEISNNIINTTYDIVKHGNPNSISDIGVANDIILASSKGASYNVNINIESINKKDKEKFEETVDYYLKQINNLHFKISKIVNKQLNSTN